MILALDQGTSSTKACVFAAPHKLLGAATMPVSQRFAPDGEATQDPQELVESCRAAAHQALRASRVTARELTGAALANQGESFLLVDEQDRPLTPVIGWQDVRCGPVIERLTALQRDEIERLTGLPVHAEFVAPKLAYHLGRLSHSGTARAATLDTWLINQLDPSRPYVTDRATASRTMLLGLSDGDWNAGLLDMFGVEREQLATIVPCDAPGASVELGGVEVPLHASGYDMGLALLGHGCLEPGDTKATFGTCLGVMSATGPHPVTAGGLLTTIAYGRGRQDVFALDGEIAAAGALVRWAVELGIATSVQELDQLAARTPDSGGVIVVPAIQGLGAPYWRDDVRAAIVGLSAASGRPQIARAVFESIAWSLRDVLDAAAAAGVAPRELRVDGGLANSTTLLQLCADTTGCTLMVSDQEEATAYGAAALAMLATGMADEGQVRAASTGTRRIDPGTPPSVEAATRWKAAIDAAMDLH